MLTLNNLTGFNVEESPLNFIASVGFSGTGGVDTAGTNVSRAGYTIVVKLIKSPTNSFFGAFGTTARLVFRGPNSGSGIINATYIGWAATSGDAYDFVATPTQVTWAGGNPSLTLAANTEYTSDNVDFDILGNASGAVIVAFQVTAGTQTLIQFSTTEAYSNNVRTSFTSGNSSVITYQRSASQTAGDTNKSTFTALTAGLCIGLRKILVA